MIKGKNHWKNRIDTKTSIAIIDRNFQWAKKTIKSISPQYFGNGKLVEAIDVLNNTFELICENGLLRNQRNPLRIDYDGSATLAAEPMLVVPPLLRRPLQLVAAIISALPNDTLQQFRNPRENRQCFALIADMIPSLLQELFNPDEIQPVLKSASNLSVDIVLIMLDYLTRPDGVCANLINDHLQTQVKHITPGH